MNLKTWLATTALMLSSTACIKQDKPLTAEMYQTLDSLHNTKTQQYQQANNQSHTQDEISTVFLQQTQSPILEQFHHYNDTIQSSDSSQQTKTSDSLWWIINRTSLSDIFLSQNTQPNQQHAKIIDYTVEIIEEPFSLSWSWKTILTDIIQPSKSIQFNQDIIRSKVFDIFAKRFSIQQNTVIFLPPSLAEQQEIYTTMDEIRSHIKSQNGIAVKLLLSKSRMKSYIYEKLGITYKSLILDNNLSYQGGSQQFEKDIGTIIDIYQ